MIKLGREKFKKGYLKEVPLHPFNETLDVFLCTDMDKLAEVFNTRYGKLRNDVKAWREDFPKNADGFMNTVYAGSDGFVKGRRIVLVLKVLDIPTIVHEAYHVLIKVAELKGAGLVNEGDEWSAYFLESLTSFIMEIKSYTEL